MANKLVLIDGNSIAYRAFFALPLLNNEKGVYTNAVYGFTTMLLKVLEEEKPTHILVAFDAGKTTFRHKTFTEYKGGRQKTPPELSEQFSFIRELLDAFNIKRFEVENYEADDIIGTLAKQAEKEDWEVKVISGDKDLLQLVSDKITVDLTRKGISNVDTYNLELVKEKYGLTPNQIIDMKGLMGDSSDNIPGVPGVGEKTAIKLLKEFGSVESVLNSIDQISGKKLKEKLSENKEQALMSKELATILCEAPVSVSLPELVYNNYNEEKVVTLFKELEFHSLLNRFDVSEDNASTTVVEEKEFQTVTEITDAMLSGESAFVVEMLNENYHQSEIIGFSIVNDTGRYFVTTEVAFESEKFKQWAKDPNRKKLVFDAKRAVVALGWQGIDLKGVKFDLFLASYILDPSLTVNEVADVASHRGKKTVSKDEVVYGKALNGHYQYKMC